MMRIKRSFYYLFRARELDGFELYGYCLMDNHIHILMKEGEELGKSVKRITVGYVQCVQWHNKKHRRTGHLFQNRYKSEVVEDDKYLIAVARYIHQNPVKVKMVRKIEEYEWSSYKDYILSYNDESAEIDTDLIMSYFGTQTPLDTSLTYIQKICYNGGTMVREVSNTTIYNI